MEIRLQVQSTKILAPKLLLKQKEKKTNENMVLRSFSTYTAKFYASQKCFYTTS